MRNRCFGICLGALLALGLSSCFPSDAPKQSPPSEKKTEKKGEKKVETAKSPSDAALLKSLVGTWKDTGQFAERDLTLVIQPDGTFRLSDNDRLKDSPDTGTITFDRANLPEIGETAVLVLKVDKAEEGGGVMPLFYFAEQDAIGDMLTFGFVREAKAAAIIAQNRREAEARAPARLAPDLGDWKLVWEAKFEEKDSDAGIATYSSGNLNLVATATAGGIRIIDASGKLTAKIDDPAVRGGTVVWLLDAGKPFLLHYTTWSQRPTAYDLEGKKLWSLDVGKGINHIAPIKIDTQNVGFVVGYNGDGGIEMYNPKKSLLGATKVPEGNTWAVSAVSLNGALPEAALAVNFGATAYSLAGKKLVDFVEKGGAGHLKGVEIVPGKPGQEVLTLGNTVASGQFLSAFASNGEKLWTAAAGASEFAFTKNPIFLLRQNKGKPYIAVADYFGVSFYSSTGDEMGRINSEISGAAALPRTDSYDFLLLRGNGFLRCYRHPVE